MKTAVNLSKKTAKKIVNSSYFYPSLVVGLVLFTEIGLYADNTTELAKMDTLTTSTIEMIFAPWVRKSALAFGTGLGLVKSYTGASIMPLISYGGLGLAVNFVPSLIDVITKVGS